MRKLLQTALQGWMADNGAVAQVPATIEGQVKLIGGTRAAAQALIDAGLVRSAKPESQLKSAQRRIESYIAQERADAGKPAALKRRHASQETRDVLKGAAQGKAVEKAAGVREQIAKRGMSGFIEGELTDPSGKQSERTCKTSIDGELLEPMLDAIAHGKWADAAAMFNGAFFEAFGLGYDWLHLYDLDDHPFAWTGVDVFEFDIG